MSGGAGGETDMMLNCKEVVHKLASDHLSAAGPWERFLFRLHLFMCRHCRRYQEQLRDIGSAARKLWSDPSQDRSSMERLKGRILKTLEGGDPPDPP